MTSAAHAAVTAAEAVAARLCSGSCLVSSAPVRGCSCSCGGEWHGQLAGALVERVDQLAEAGA